MSEPGEPFAEQSVARQLDYCTFCPKMCRHACPVSTASGRETYIPQVKMDRLNQLRLGHAGWTAEASDPLWACTGCRHCTMYCLHGNEPGLVLFTGRAVAVARGVSHPALAGYSERFRAREQRLSAQLAVMFEPRLATAGEIGYWPGCDAIDKSASDIAAALALFELRAQYPAEGINLRTEIVSLADLLAPAAANLACPVTRRSVYYHDPCYHARYNGVVEQPRRALSQLAELRELAWNRTDTECCGAGGLLPKTMPAIADQMARRRLAEVQSTGGGMVVTSCASCAFLLQRNAPPSVEVANLATAMAQLSETAFTPPASAADDDT